MLSLPRAAYDEILAHAAGSDGEICGILAGERGGDDPGGESRVEAVHRATNVADNPETRYVIDPEEQLRIIEAIEDGGREVVGFYHSHPEGPPVPSETDAERAAWPGYSYAICVPGEHPYLGSWRWTGERFEREAVALRP
ncbi:desampylase [Halolamina salifodinae]|uniref:Proteasome lid subunit RPN8/RPN11 n=1 Tax=Halolamina salifodinae TaxID=1202767 RepID=A0A8T4GY46_9EURY|nr:desampylase [Halolamina salifodinae]MBP1987340.1 proteasome lid subunit RPN8/RPN11 [Halolamina salifodinae]